MRPLLAAPQPVAREPLTDEQIRAMLNKHPPEDVCGWSYRMGIDDAELHHGIKGGQPAQAEEPVAWLRNTTDQIADYVADNWPMRKYDLSEIEQRLRMLASAPSGPAREPLTDEHIQDLLLCGDPTDEEMRLIRIGWDAASGIKGDPHG